MKKIILAAAFVVAGFVGVKAQSGVQFGGGINLNLPVGDLSNGYSFGVGAELQGEYKFSESASAIGTTGFTHLFGKDFGGYKPKLGIIPILVGARYYPSSQFYVGGQIGYSFFVEDGDGGGFAFKPQVGYDAGQFQLGVAYNGVSNNGTGSWIGLSGIFKFGGK